MSAAKISLHKGVCLVRKSLICLGLCVVAITAAWAQKPVKPVKQPMPFGVAWQNVNATCAMAADELLVGKQAKAFRVGPYILRTRLQQIRIEDATTTTQRRIDAVSRPSELVKDSSRVIRVEGFLPNVSSHFEIQPGMVKENIVLSSVPDPALVNTEAVLFVFQTDTSLGATLTASIENSELVWKNNSGNVVFRFLKPYVFDAQEREITSRYLLRGSFYAVAMPARQVREATYPITIDPTTSTNQAAQTSYRSTYEELGSADDHEAMYLEFTLPDLTGETITAATCTLTNTDTGSSINPVLIYCDDQVDWSNATGQATLDGFTFGAQTDSVTFEGTAGSETFSVYGSASEGLLKIYTADGSPDPCTVKVIDSSMGATTDSVTTALRIGSGSSQSIVFINGSDATSYPYLTITYGTVTTIPGRKATSAGVIGG